jgi:hypothetical protein
MTRPNWFKGNEDILDDVRWITTNLSDPKLCSICKKRAGKTSKEIKELNDGYPIEAPCHDGCRCVWAPKIKTAEELLGPKLGKGIDFDFSNIKYDPQVYKTYATQNQSPNIEYTLIPLTPKGQQALQKKIEIFLKKLKKADGHIELPDMPFYLRKGEGPCLYERSIRGEAHVEKTSPKRISEGALALTNQRLVFAINKSPHPEPPGIEIDLSSILNLKAWLNCIEVNTKSKIYFFTVKNPILWVFLISGFSSGNVKETKINITS